MALIQDSMAIFAFCSGVCALVFWIGGRPWAAGFFRVVPSIVFVYYIPTLASTLGILPTQSPAYDWMRDYLLPFSLFILMISTDIPTVLRVGPRAIGMMLFGTAGVVVGGPVVYILLGQWLPPDSWKGLAALSGSWIGGGGNFAAIKESVGAPDSIIGPIIIVDTAVGYTWMGVLFFLAGYQRILDRWNRADTTVIEELNLRLREVQEARSRPITLADASLIIGLGFLGAVICRTVANSIYSSTDPWLFEYAPAVASIFSPFTWLVVLISTLGIALSFTPLRNLELAGASKLGYTGLYLFLTSIGARADLGGLVAAPLLLAAGVLWILIHVFFLVLGARILRAPMFLVAVGSQANIGGAASAPIVAAAYYHALAPVGLLLGVLGYVLGTYAGLVCAYLLQWVA